MGDVLDRPQNHKIAAETLTPRFREKWFFGLAVEENDSIFWLKSNKELLRQRVQKDTNGVVQVKFLVKVFIHTKNKP